MSIWLQDLRYKNKCISNRKKKKKKKDTSNPHYIPQKSHPPNKNSYTNSLLRMTTLISKLFPLFVTSDKGKSVK